MFVKSTTCDKIETAQGNVERILLSLTKSTLVEAQMAKVRIPSTCPNCSISFINRRNPRQKFCSSRCNATFYGAFARERVKKLHAAKLKTTPKHICPICGQIFSRNKALTKTNLYSKTCSLACGAIRKLEIRTLKFWQKLALTSDTNKCWLWQGASVCKGYGEFELRIENKKEYRAHRVAYYLFYQVAPKKLHVLHRCDNPLCCNPHHLFLGTAADNISDCINKGRKALGEKAGNAKLTESQVKEIRRLYVPHNYSAHQLGREFNVSQQTVSEIVNRKTWKHI